MTDPGSTSGPGVQPTNEEEGAQMDWTSMSIQEQRQKYGSVRQKLVESGTMESQQAVDDLYTSLRSVHEHPDTLELIEQLIRLAQLR